MSDVMVPLEEELVTQPAGVMPQPIIDFLVTALGTVEGIEGVEPRLLTPNDPDSLIGVACINWTPTFNEIGQVEPAGQQYLFSIQCFVKHADRAEGIALHLARAKAIREMILRNRVFKQRFGMVHEDNLGYRERVQRFGIRQQRFMDTEINNTFIYLSVAEFWVETETVFTGG